MSLLIIIIAYICNGRWLLGNSVLPAYNLKEIGIGYNYDENTTFIFGNQSQPLISWIFDGKSGNIINATNRFGRIIDLGYHYASQGQTYVSSFSCNCIYAITDEHWAGLELRRINLKTMDNDYSVSVGMFIITIGFNILITCYMCYSDPKL